MFTMFAKLFASIPVSSFAEVSICTLRLPFATLFATSVMFIMGLVIIEAINIANITEIATKTAKITTNNILDWLAVICALLLDLFSMILANSHITIISALASSAIGPKLLAICMPCS